MTSRAHLTFSIVGGIFAGFIATMFVQFDTSHIYLGQLLAGNQTVNRTMPTTLNALKTVTDGTDPMITGLTQMGFWITFVSLSIISSVILFQWMRRFA